MIHEWPASVVACVCGRIASTLPCGVCRVGVWPRGWRMTPAGAKCERCVRGER